ncbi:HD domain-containing phosphohydrolase [Thermobacillus sp. ZCTH02-B1]|uniref:HD-GYP domain-containing protein n=1 Tax=Thermobacillus sp. ZCTH02-B1 TaxID=1858795 RepID=UPI0025E474A6|nr:HD domain-containing phosphohydrolase [Thermobacillus sp. ZCTH02-B1]
MRASRSNRSCCTRRSSPRRRRSFSGWERSARAGRRRRATTSRYEHHEKWDGTGYPRGLKGEEIHLYGRITAVADVFDALGSDRVYKKAWELDRILTLFREERGRHFDPQLVDVFMEELPRILEVRDRYRDELQE